MSSLSLELVAPNVFSFLSTTAMSTLCRVKRAAATSTKVLDGLVKQGSDLT